MLSLPSYSEWRDKFCKSKVTWWDAPNPSTNLYSIYLIVMQIELSVGKKRKVADSWVEVMNIVEKIVVTAATMTMEIHKTLGNTYLYSLVHHIAENTLIGFWVRVSKIWIWTLFSIVVVTSVVKSALLISILVASVIGIWFHYHFCNDDVVVLFQTFSFEITFTSK